MSAEKRGRPPKSGNKLLSERLEIRLEPGEKQLYDAAAEAAGMERSDWIRYILNRAAGHQASGEVCASEKWGR